MSKDKFKSKAPEPSPLANNEGIVDDHGETNTKPVDSQAVVGDDLKVADPVKTAESLDEATAQGTIFQVKKRLMQGLESNRGEPRIPRDVVYQALNLLGVRDSDFPT